MITTTERDRRADDLLRSLTEASARIETALADPAVHGSGEAIRPVTVSAVRDAVAKIDAAETAAETLLALDAAALEAVRFFSQGGSRPVE